MVVCREGETEEQARRRVEFRSKQLAVWRALFPGAPSAESLSVESRVRELYDASDIYENFRRYRSQYSSTVVSDEVTRVRRVVGLQFGLLSPEHILTNSVVDDCGIVETDYTNNDGKPKRNGLLDDRLGPLTASSICGYCGESIKKCPGHFGHVNLSVPVYHVGYRQIILKLLRCVCYNCSKLLIPKTPEFLSRVNRVIFRHRLEYVVQHCKNKANRVCRGNRLNDPLDVDSVPSVNDGCGAHQPSYRLNNLDIFCDRKNVVGSVTIDVLSMGLAHGENIGNADGSNAPRTRNECLSPQYVRRILQRISDEDCKILGFDTRYARPEWMVLTRIPVPPVCVRPTLIINGVIKSHDDLTSLLWKIVDKNNVINGYVKNSNAYSSNTAIAASCEHVRQLQHFVSALIDNELPNLTSVTQRQDKVLQSLKMRLKGKDGRIRGNLMGKRVDFSARTVITADPNLRIDEIAVPPSIASDMTIPELVTPLNYDRLVGNVRNGSVYPGAKYVITNDGKRYDVSVANSGDDNRNIRRLANGRALKVEFGTRTKINNNTPAPSESVRRKLPPLQCGSIVERHLQNGDVVIFNRQPTLHKPSMMAHRIRILPWSSFRMNLSCTTPYNADFDGDEMNIHVPQSIETRAEATCLMTASRQILSSAGNGTTMGIVQDALIGLYKLSGRNVFLTRDDFFALVGVVRPRATLSDLPVPAIRVRRSDNRGFVEFWTGKQIFGMLLDSNFDFEKRTDSSGIEERGALRDDVLIIRRGELLNDVISKRIVGVGRNNLIHAYRLEFGAEKCANLLYDLQILGNEWLMTRGHTVGYADIKIDPNLRERIRDEVKTIVRAVDDLSNRSTNDASIERVVRSLSVKIGSWVAKTSSRNNLRTMIDAGSKGALTNMVQIMGTVGQQDIAGARIPCMFDRRTLPRFLKDDNGIEARGFCVDSYFDGLKPHEFFFHAMAGREGVIDTAVKTSETGYIQRRLIKAMETLIVHYDGTVRFNNGAVVQYAYGEDGFANEYLIRQPIDRGDDDDDNTPYVKKRDDDDETTSNERILTNVRKNFGYTRKDLVDANVIDCDRAEFKRHRWFEFTLLANVRRNCVTNEKTVRIPFNFARAIELTLRKQRTRLEFENNDDVRNDVNDRNGDTSDTGDKFRNDSHRYNLDSQVTFVVARKLLYEYLNECCNGGASKESRFFFDFTESKFDENARLSFVFLEAALSAFSTKRLLAYRFTKRSFVELLVQMRDAYFEASVAPGEMVGAIAAQVIGEPATQMTLNTFHFAGISEKNVTLGIPRFRELINVVKQPKRSIVTVYPNFNVESCAISVDEPYDVVYARYEERVRALAVNFVHTTVGDVLIDAKIWYDPSDTSVPNDGEWICNFDGELAKFDETCTNLMKKYISPWVLRLRLNPEKLLAKNVTVQSIVDRIDREFDYELYVIHSDNVSSPIIRIRTISSVIADELRKLRATAKIKFNNAFDERGGGGDIRTTTGRGKRKRDEESVKLKRTKKLPIAFPTAASNASLNDGRDGGGGGGVNGNNNNNDDDVALGPDILYVISAFVRNDIRIAGVDDICSPSIIKIDGGAELAITLNGANLIGILGYRDVDTRRTTSNDPLQILQVFGVEAARRCLIEEIHKVFAVYGIRIDYRHLSLLGDTMTARGSLMPITRHGINKQDTSPLMRCSFEETVDVLLDAAACSERDFMRGVTENIIMGQIPRIGTGFVDVIMPPPGTRNDVYKNSIIAAADDISSSSSVAAATAAILSRPSSNFDRLRSLSDRTSSRNYVASSTNNELVSADELIKTDELINRISENSPKYDPHSPTYAFDSLNSSPTSVPKYVPFSPEYVFPSPDVVVVDSQSEQTRRRSPHTSKPYILSSSTYTPQSPTYTPRSPKYIPLSPTYTPQSPKYTPLSPTHTPRSPKYTPLSPTHTPRSPKYVPLSPTYTPRSPK